MLKLKIWQHKKAKAGRYWGMDLKNFCILPENSAEGLRSRRALLVFHSMSSRIRPRTLWFKEGCSWSILVIYLRLMSQLHAYISTPAVYWRKWPNWQAHLQLCNRNPNNPERALNQIVLSNSTAGKCTSMQVIKQPENENLNNWWTKMILLMLIANNSKSFLNGSKPIIRHNLGLCKHFEI